MKFFHMLGLILMLCFIACGSAEESTFPSSDNSSSPAAVTAELVPATGLALASLSNDQPNTSLILDPGVILVSFQAYGPQRMQFNQNCKHCWLDPSEIQITGPFNGSHAYGIPVKDECTINISGSGTWTAQVSRMDLNTSLKPPVNLSGSGTAVSPSFYLEKGNYIFQRNETREASPLYALMLSNGSYLMNVNNTYIQPGFGDVYGFSSSDTFRIFDIPESGTYFLSVYAKDNPKPWNVSIISIPPAPVMGPGPAILKTS